MQMRIVLIVVLLLCFSNACVDKVFGQLPSGVVSNVSIGVLGDPDLALYYYVRAAVDDINSRTDLLPNTTLLLRYVDLSHKGLSNPTVDIAAALQFIQTFQVAMILGARYTADSQEVAYVCNNYAVPQLSYATSGTAFSDKTQFPWFSRLTPDQSSEAAQLATFILRQGWTHVVVVYTTDTTSLQMFSAFLNIASEYGISIIGAFIIPSASYSDWTTFTNYLLSTNGRIFVDLNLWASLAPQMSMAEAAVGLRGSQYSWICWGSCLLSFWRNADGSNMATAWNSIQGMFIFYPQPANTTSPQYLTMLQQLNTLPPFYANYSSIPAISSNNVTLQQALLADPARATRAYDGLYVIAKTLHQLMYVDGLNPLEISNRQNMQSILRNVSFQGAEGLVAMNPNTGDSLTGWAIGQVPYNNNAFSGANPPLIGYFNYDPNAPANDLLAVWPYVSVSSIIWPNGVAPSDVPAAIIENAPLGQVAVTVLMAVGMCSSVALMLLLWLYRTHPILKASSLVFCQLILLGSIFGYAFMNVSAPSTSANCSQAAILLSFGFSIIVGSLVVKTWRIHVIFNLEKLTVLRLRNGQLMFPIGTLLAIDAIILGLWFGWDNATLTLTADNNMSNTFFHSCQSNHWNTFLIALIVPKCLLLLFGVWLTFRIRNVQLLFNECRSLMLSIYNFIILGITGLSLTWAFSNQYVSSYWVKNMCVFLSILICNTALFVSKLYIVFTEDKSKSMNLTPRTPTPFGLSTVSKSPAADDAKAAGVAQSSKEKKTLSVRMSITNSAVANSPTPKPCMPNSTPTQI